MRGFSWTLCVTATRFAHPPSLCVDGFCGSCTMFFDYFWTDAHFLGTKMSAASGSGRRRRCVRGLTLSLSDEVKLILFIGFGETLKTTRFAVVGGVDPLCGTFVFGALLFG